MTHHGAGLRQVLLKENQDSKTIDTLIENLKTNYETADLNEAEMFVLNYVKKLTIAPNTIAQTDIEQLKNQGFDDRGIHDICSVAAYFAFVNRIANGLGVELE